MAKRIDMTGRVFGDLTVLQQDTSKTRGVHWVCRCSCGKVVSVYGSRLRSGHTSSCGHRIQLGSVRRDVMDRFIEKTETTDSGCIVWTASTNGVGYGSFYVGRSSPGEHGRGYAHRWAYETFVGPIPDGLHLDHLCRNPICVNPDHLEPVTVRENLLRGEGPAAKHARKTHCPRGHEYAGDNLYIHPTKGMRFCRTCGRDRARLVRRKKKEETHGYRGNNSP